MTVLHENFAADVLLVRGGKRSVAVNRPDIAFGTPLQTAIVGLYHLTIAKRRDLERLGRAGKKVFTASENLSSVSSSTTSNAALPVRLPDCTDTSVNPGWLPALNVPLASIVP